VTVNFDYNLELRAWPGQGQDEPACQIPKIIQFRSYCPDTHTHTEMIALTGPLQWSVMKTHSDHLHHKHRQICYAMYSSKLPAHYLTGSETAPCLPWACENGHILFCFKAVM